MITKICQHCGKDYPSFPSRANSRFCSRACSAIARTRSNSLIPVECETCGKLYEVYPSKFKHGARFCSRECAKNANRGRTPSNAKPWIDLVCQYCGAHYSLPPAAAEVSKYCSKACSSKAKIGKSAHNAQGTITALCPQCGESFTTNSSASRKRKFCSKACVLQNKRENIGANHPLFKPKTPMPCEMCGTIKLVKPSLVSRFRFCSRRCSGAWVATTWPRTSSLERALITELTRRDIQFVHECPIGPYTVDFAFPEHRLVVEADGSYWHGLEKQQSKDARKDSYLISHNWKVLRLPESEIRSDIIDCVDRISILLQTHR